MYREAKQEVGLDKYEGRGWLGFMHHVTVVLCCYAFLVAEREGAFPPWGAQGGQKPWARSIQSAPDDTDSGAPPAAHTALDPDHASSAQPRGESLAAPAAAAPSSPGPAATC